MHDHGAEHWLVDRVIDEVTYGDKVVSLSESQIARIPIGQVHPLRKSREVLPEIIKVQSGSNLGENASFCLEETHGRTSPLEG